MGPRSVKEPNATYFAPAASASDAELAAAVREVARNPLLVQILDAVGSVMVVLNTERQIVAANEAAHKLLGLTLSTADEALGMRPGEALCCVQVANTPNGCGTGKPCANCGASRAIVDALLNHRTVEYECALRVFNNGHEQSHEYLARVAPLEATEPPLLLLTLHDIADKKRHETLERVFLHDLMNTLSALSAYRGLATGKVLAEPEYLQEMGSLIDRVIDEVKTHRSLMSAEHERLSVHLEHVTTQDIAEHLKVAFSRSELTAERHLTIECSNESFETDRTLLIRVLTNLMKNAFEATPPEGTVTLRCYREDQKIVFAVANAGKIPDEVAAHIFTRSFTTKTEPGHGIGTYSIKLFGERYLRGRISFTTSEAGGTEFVLQLPLRFGADHESLVRIRTKHL